jgi:hypothetical protein
MASASILLAAAACIDPPSLEGRLCTRGRCPDGLRCGPDDRCRRATPADASDAADLDIGPSDAPGEADAANGDAEEADAEEADAEVDAGGGDAADAEDDADTGPDDADAGPIDIGVVDTGVVDTGVIDAGVCLAPPTPWCSGASFVAAASVGFVHTCARLGDQSLWCWGGNDDGQLGLGNSGAGTERTTPAQVGGSFIEVDAGLWHTCAIDPSNALYCWGANTFSKLGLGDTAPRSFPTRVGMANDWFRVAAGRSHSCALKTNRTLWCWGQRQLGQPGQTTPLQIGTRTDWDRLSTENDHSCALTTNGELYCWGLNLYGELGQGDTVERVNPTRIGALTGWDEVEPGWFFTCAVRNGELWCWGLNDEAQLGLGDTIDRDVPVRVGAGADWRSVDTGYHHACAIKTNDTLHCWGQNNLNQLGLGAGAPASVTSPMQIGTDADWSQIIVGDFHTCATKGDGSLWCWGVGSAGRLGLGDTTGRDHPVDLCCP